MFLIDSSQKHAQVNTFLARALQLVNQGRQTPFKAFKNSGLLLHERVTEPSHCLGRGPGHDPLLVGRDQENRHTARIRGERGLARGRLVFLGIEVDPELRQALADRRPHLGAVFPDSP